LKLRGRRATAAGYLSVDEAWGAFFAARAGVLISKCPERKAEDHNGADFKIKIPTLQYFVISLVPYSGNL
jgi:hypothetical protein